MNFHQNGPGRRHALAAAAALAALAPAAAPAMDTFFVGARGQGMAGSLTAAVDDVDAQYYNPAAFGFFGRTDSGGEQLAQDNNNLGRKDFGLGVDVGVGARIHGDLLDYADRLSEYDYEQFDDGIQDTQEAGELMSAFSDLNGIGQPGNAMVADFNAGAGLRIRQAGIGVRSYLQAGAVAELDKADLRPADYSLDQLGDDLSSVSTDSSIDKLNDDQEKRLDSLLQEEVDSGNLTTDQKETAINALDDAAQENDLSDKEVEEAVSLIEDTYSSSTTSGAVADGGLSTSDNDTALILRGFQLVEVPVTYGHAFDDPAFVGGEWSVGANLKLMRGTVYANKVYVLREDADDNLMSDLRNESKTSSTIGVDVGVMGRYEWINVGLMARNVNSPTFDGTTVTMSDNSTLKVSDVTVDPQVRAGVAFIPFNTLTLEGDLDLTENETILAGYHTQYASVGLEWDAFRFLALRGGFYENLAEDDIGRVYTAGLGLNLWLLRLDLGAAMSADTTEVDGEDIPKVVRANAEVTIDF